MEIVINLGNKPFCLSHEAILKFIEYEKLDIKIEQDDIGKYNYYSNDEDQWSYWDIRRNNINLVNIVKELGDKAIDNGSILKVVHVPDFIYRWGVYLYYIKNCGYEFITPIACDNENIEYLGYYMQTNEAKIIVEL